MNKDLTDLETAFMNVSDKYTRVTGMNVNDVEYDQVAENSFTAELFHQFRCIMDMPANLKYYSNLSLHFDLNKERFNGQRPDIVLHRAPKNRDDQRLFIEVKTGAHANLNDDLDKLISAVTDCHAEHTEWLGFKIAVEVVGNQRLLDVHRKIREYSAGKGLNAEDYRMQKLYLYHFLRVGEEYQYTINSFPEILQMTVV